jgi:hypothetical protein
MIRQTARAAAWYFFAGGIFSLLGWNFFHVYMLSEWQTGAHLILGVAGMYAARAKSLQASALYIGFVSLLLLAVALLNVLAPQWGVSFNGSPVGALVQLGIAATGLYALKKKDTFKG